MIFFTEDKNKKCEEFIKIITNRLKELEAETNELKEYQRLDKDKRALEYSLAEHELNVSRISNEYFEIITIINMMKWDFRERKSDCDIKGV